MRLVAHFAVRVPAVIKLRYSESDIADTGRLPRELVGQDVDLLDRRQLAEQFVGFLHQRRADASRQMRLPRVIVGERVENAERGWAEFDGKPSDRPSSPSRTERQSCKNFSTSFLTWLRLQAYEQRYVDHWVLLRVDCRNLRTTPLWIWRRSGPAHRCPR